MFNPERKERFIKERAATESVANVFRDIFRIAEKYESEAGKDVSAMNEQEGRPLADDLMNVRGSSVGKRVSLLKSYVRWCVGRYEDATGEFANISPNPGDGMKQRMVRNSIELRKWLDSVFDPPDMQTVQNVFRAYLWLGFLGLTDDEAFGLSASAVDWQMYRINLLRCGERTEIVIPREAHEELKNCATLQAFKIYRPNDTRTYERQPGNRLLRTTGTIEPDIRYLRQKITKLTVEAENRGRTNGRRITFSYAYLSGLFSRTLDAERCGTAPNFAEAGRLFADEKIAANPERDTQEIRDDIAKRKIRELNKDYRQWKRVFYGI